MGKQHQYKKKPTKREQYYLKNKKAFDEGNVVRANLKKYPPGKIREYLEKELATKYRRQDVTVSCPTCGVHALYDTGGYISDEELLEQLGRTK